MNFRPLCVASVFVFLTGVLPRAAAVDFLKDVQPILKKNCYECHSEERKKEKAGYVFDNLKRFSHDIGVNLNIEPGSPGSSHFFEVLSDPSVKHHMPPKGSLAQPDLDKIRKWIEEGAVLDKNAPKTAPGGTPAPTTARPDLPPIMSWTNVDGKTIKAGFGGMQGDNVMLKMFSGQVVPYPMSKLSPESQKQARDAAGVGQ